MQQKKRKKLWHINETQNEILWKQSINVAIYTLREHISFKTVPFQSQTYEFVLQQPLRFVFFQYYLLCCYFPLCSLYHFRLDLISSFQLCVQESSVYICTVKTCESKKFVLFPSRQLTNSLCLKSITTGQRAQTHITLPLLNGT